MNDKITKLISSLNLAPMKAYAQVNNQEAFNQPYQELFNQFKTQDLRPNYEYNTLNPYKTNFGYSAAVGNGNLMGNSGAAYDNQVNNLERGFNTDAQSAKNQIMNVAGQTYQNLRDQYYTGPGAFTTNNPNAMAQTNPTNPQPAASTQSTASSPSSFNNYQVKSGDTLSGIWNNMYKNKIGYGDFVNQAVKNNGLKNANSIYSGSTLKLPGM